MTESEGEFTSRLDRDSVYRIHALYNAVNRASLFRDILKEDKIEVLALADVYYHWLKGNGHKTDSPEIEETRE